jgi:pimeloyl-ACP methyl ester carboxylesterase
MGELSVPGARLYYEVVGTGPPLLTIIGGAADAHDFDFIAPILAERYTVVRYDQRGSSRSQIEDPPEGDLIERLADDAHRLLRAVTTEPAYVLGCSGGAQTGFALATTYPEQVRTLVAYEPPTSALLPTSDLRHALGRDVHHIYRRDGIIPAVYAFIVGTGLDNEPGPRDVSDRGALDVTALMAERRERMRNNVGFFFDHLIEPVTTYLPDPAALRHTLARIVVGVGEESAGQLGHECGLAVAERLGKRPVMFPGGHSGYFTRPAAFARKLRDVFQTVPHAVGASTPTA